MNCSKTIISIMVFLSLGATHAFGDDNVQHNNHRRHHGPPPEAYAACEGKSAGDEAQFVSPHGETVAGTCEQEGDRLFLRPDNPKGRSGGHRHGPPPEAYAACKGKNVGDMAEFENRHGNTVTGTCEKQGNRLVLRPDAAPEHRQQRDNATD